VLLERAKNSHGTRASNMRIAPDNVEHRIQLKKIQIEGYKRAIRNYPPDRMKRYGIPYLDMLLNELYELEKEKSYYDTNTKKD
jgi:hypothetical protein